MLATGPGPTFPLALPIAARAFDGGARLDRTAATATVATTRITSPPTRRRSSTAVVSGGFVAMSAGRVRRRFTEAISIAPSRSDALTMIAWPYDVCHRDARVGRWSTDAQIPEPSSAMTETKATFEKRGTQTARPASRFAVGRLPISTN